MRFLARVFLPLLLLVYIATETYLKLQHTSLCGEVGCKLAAELLNFDALYLNYAGMAGVFSLIILGLLSLKNKFYEHLFFVGLYGAITFEATIISYQFIVNSEPCIFCLGIFSSLLIIALFSHAKHFLITLVTVGAIFIGLSTLSVTKNKTFISESGNYLIQSDSCPHCIKVKAYFSEHNIAYTSISTQEASVRSFLKFAGITSIPVLIVNEKLQRTLLVGDKKIISYFKSIDTKSVSKMKTKHIVNTAMQSSSLNLTSGGFTADFLNGENDDGGCAISIVKTASCDKNKTD